MTIRNEAEARWCNLCKELNDVHKMRAHGYIDEFKLDKAGKITVKKLECGCRIEKCFAGKKSYSQCSYHRGLK